MLRHYAPHIPYCDNARPRAERRLADALIDAGVTPIDAHNMHSSEWPAVVIALDTLDAERVTELLRQVQA